MCYYLIVVSIRPLLLDCPNKEMRTAFYNIIGTTIHNYYNHKLHVKVSSPLYSYYCYLSIVTVSLYNVLQQQSDSIAIILEQLLALLNKEVVESFCTCTEYFNFFQMLCTQVSIVFCNVLQYFAIFYNILQYFISCIIFAI